LSEEVDWSALDVVGRAVDEMDQDELDRLTAEHEEGETMSEDDSNTRVEFSDEQQQEINRIVPYPPNSTATIPP
jgi:hypothetical protein